MALFWTTTICPGGLERDLAIRHCSRCGEAYFSVLQATSCWHPFLFHTLPCPVHAECTRVHSLYGGRAIHLLWHRAGIYRVSQATVRGTQRCTHSPAFKTPSSPSPMMHCAACRITHCLWGSLRMHAPPLCLHWLCLWVLPTWPYAAAYMRLPRSWESRFLHNTGLWFFLRISIHYRKLAAVWSTGLGETIFVDNTTMVLARGPFVLVLTSVGSAASSERSAAPVTLLGLPQRFAGATLRNIYDQSVRAPHVQTCARVHVMHYYVPLLAHKSMLESFLSRPPTPPPLSILAVKTSNRQQWSWCIFEFSLW